MLLTGYLDPKSLLALEETCKHAQLNVADILYDPVQLLRYLDACSRVKKAMFFRVYGRRLQGIVQLILLKNSENYAAYALSMMMSKVSVETIDVDKAQRTLDYLVAKQFPQSIIHSIEFILSVLSSPRLAMRDLLHQKSHFYINLNSANLHDENLDHCDLTGACLENADITDVSAKGAIFECANLRGAHLTFSDFEDACFRLAVLDNVRDDLGFPHEPNFKNARFFNENEILSVEMLNEYRSNLPDFIVDAILEDFIKHTQEAINDGMREDLLTGAHCHPVFADHKDFVVGYISKHFFTLFTSQQKRIDKEICKDKVNRI